MTDEQIRLNGMASDAYRQYKDQIIVKFKKLCERCKGMSEKEKDIFFNTYGFFVIDKKYSEIVTKDTIIHGLRIVC